MPAGHPSAGQIPAARAWYPLGCRARPATGPPAATADACGRTADRRGGRLRLAREFHIIASGKSGLSGGKNGRGGEIRTHDLLHPKQARIPGYATPRTIPLDCSGGTITMPPASLIHNSKKHAPSTRCGHRQQPGGLPGITSPVRNTEINSPRQGQSNSSRISVREALNFRTQFHCKFSHIGYKRPSEGEEERAHKGNDEKCQPQKGPQFQQPSATMLFFRYFAGVSR